MGQLGCTLVPSWHIRQMICRPPPRNFDLAHKVSQSRPWRCAFDCSDPETTLRQMAFRAGHRSPDTPLDGHRQYDWPFESMEALARMAVSHLEDTADEEGRGPHPNRSV